MGDDVLFELGGRAMQATFHVDEGVGTTTVETSTVVALGLASVVAPALGFFPKLTQRTPHPQKLLTCHGQEYIASPTADETNY